MRRFSSRSARVLVTFALSLAAVVATSVASPAVADYRVPGIDVSKYQGKIDWRAVGFSKVRFAIMRATLGNAYRDGKYARNVDGARANGIVVGAYHFAKPGLAPQDPRLEADHFLRVARVAPGDIVPVLDIEDSGGLSERQLRSWALRWLNRVETRTGVRPMIYAGNHFWRGSMGNTGWFGRRGYSLWVAHWYVPAPSVPGGDWAGRGYTVWQWSARGNIPGIRGPVDRDWVRGSLGRATIASIEVQPSDGGRILGPRLVCGGLMSVCSRMVSPGDPVTLTARPSDGGRVLRWTGACVHAGDASTCTLSAFRAKTVSVVFSGPGAAEGAEAAEEPTTASAAPAPSPSPSPDPSPSPSPNPSPSPSPDPSPSPSPNPSAEPASAARAPGPADGTRFSWSLRIDRHAIGGSYRWERRASASVAYAFRGDRITLYTIEGPSMGRAKVSIDGVRVATIDGYRPRLRSVGRRFTGLGWGRHTLRVVPLGDKRPAARDRRVAVDALRWDGHLHPDPKPEAVSWATVENRAASDGRLAISDAVGAQMAFDFTGSAISLDAVRGPAGGRATVWVDGRHVRTIDLYAPSSRVEPVEVAAGLADGPHQARLVVQKERNRASKGREVAIDRWIVSYRPERGRPHAEGHRNH
ncbi:MAG TPA: GH25 family lysozyme [Actinomycetota bacterium]|nr:GH25 family lysozyme [Actinomycetota bacterium]